MKFLCGAAILLFLLCEARAKKVKFQDCGSEKGKLISVDLTPCSSDPCVIKRGANASGVITFIPHEVVTSSKVLAYAIFGLIPVPLPLPNSDGCKGYGLTCPLKSGKQVELVFEHYIDQTFPTGHLTLKAELKDQDSDVVICGKIPMTLE
ncbi:NPC intracellular cholesterol transporter 2 [Nematostella vectensis]|uniref:NPC intracellular cholesterol transporter 2 n=1 Tax=Nematostella vectensis TaxID=45351 RepID=UPI00207775E7|nr:NPC intracellular cholesterol transporter 2 [Nematostella vectensis]XP_032230972.2 NPC intracellular cholesterol transporter 2 [Nematostella vectensis]